MGIDDYRRPRQHTPPPGESLHARVAVLEQQDNHLRDLLAKMEAQVVGLSEQIRTLGDNVLLLAERAATAAKSRDTWKNWFLGVASAIAVLLIGFVATIAWRVQTGRLPPT